MSLTTYNKKRKFNETPEPKGKAVKATKALHFVVQKHEATRLHYDFRLEHAGVLVSWAVPKGPTLKLGEKHLAMKVEDHPVSYMQFEGTIPPKNYGAGTVMVWDFGNYLALGAKDLAESEKMIRKGLKEGQIKVVLNGKKLQGGFALIKLKNGFGGKDSWLMLKERDEYAKNLDVTKKDKSALSGKSMTQISKSKKQWHSNK
jgi:bifunctional non-homologous end joining protein LigD